MIISRPVLLTELREVWPAVLIVLAFGRGYSARLITEPACHVADAAGAMLFLVVALLGYLAVGALLIMDIGRWPQFYNVMIPGYWNLHSFLEDKLSLWC